MSLRAGSFISVASTPLKFYSEFESKTDDYILKRIIMGSRVFLEIVIKSNASSFTGLELIPADNFKHFFYDRMVLTTQNLDGQSQSGDTGMITFNKLVRDNSGETISLIDTNDEYDYAWTNSFDVGSRHPSNPLEGSNLLPIIQNTGVILNYLAESTPLVGRVNVITIEGTVTGIYDLNTSGIA